MQIGQTITIRVKDEFKHHYTYTEYTGRIYDIDDEHILVDTNRYVIGTFDIIWQSVGKTYDRYPKPLPKTVNKVKMI